MFLGRKITLCLFKKPVCVLILCTQSSPYTDYRDQSKTVQIMCCLATINLDYRPEYQRSCLHPTKARVYKARTGVVQVTICFWYLNSWLLLSCRWLVTCHLLWHSYSGIANTKEAQGSWHIHLIDDAEGSITQSVVLTNKVNYRPVDQWAH